MTLDEATRQGIARLRRPNWANAGAYLKIDLVEGGFRGPWGHLYDRAGQGLSNSPTPQTFLLLGDTTADYESYAGALDPEDET